LVFFGNIAAHSRSESSRFSATAFKRRSDTESMQHPSITDGVIMPPVEWLSEGQ
jgi:hypothetical protein